MALNEEFKNFVLDQLLALLREGSAFAKIKHDKVWLKVDDGNLSNFERHGMSQYTYGKDNSRKLNFYETPIEIIEDRDKLKDWVQKSIEITLRK